MRAKNILLTALLTVASLSAIQAGPRCRPLYIFGVSTSFNDSIVYLTDIQLLDSAWIEERGNMIVKRSEYSTQLKNHFVSKGQLNRTCAVVFSDSEKKILKKHAKLKKRYLTDKKRALGYDYREIDIDEFRFKSVGPDIYEDAAPAMDKKAQRKAEKARRKMEKKGMKSPGIPSTDAPAPPMPPRR